MLRSKLIIGSLVVASVLGIASVAAAQAYTGASMCVEPSQSLGNAIVMPIPGGWLKGLYHQTPTGAVFMPVPDGWMPALIPAPSGVHPVEGYVPAEFSLENGAWVNVPVPGGWMPVSGGWSLSQANWSNVAVPVPGGWSQ